MTSAKPRKLPLLQESFTDDPVVVQRQKIDDYAAHVVPMTWRAGRWSMSMAWYALASAMAWLLTAGVAAVQVGPRDALIGAGLSVFAYSGICSAMATYAARTGTNVNMFSRMIFGLRGGVIATLVLFAIATFYATFEGAVVAHAFSVEFGGPSLSIWYLIVVLYSVPLAVGGVRVFLDKFNGALLPIYIMGLVAAVVWTISERGYKADWLSGQGTSTVAGPGWVYSFSLYMGVWVLMMFTGDLARQAKVEDLRFHRWFTFGPVFHGFTLFVNAVVGIFLAEHLVVGELTELSAVDGMLALMGVWAVALIWVTQSRINTANYYVASSNLANLVGRVIPRSIPRWVWVVVLGALVYLLMLQDLLHKLSIALQYSGIITVAWVGAVLAYMLWAKVQGIPPENVEYRPGRVLTVNWTGVIAWVAGTAVGVVLLNWGGSVGLTWFAPGAVVVSFVVYSVALLIKGDASFVLSRPADPRSEVADAWESRIRCHHCGHSYVAQEMDRDPSTGHQAICCECAAASRQFLEAAHHEATTAERIQTTLKCQLAMRVFTYFLNRTPEVASLLEGWDKTLQFDLEGERAFHIVVEEGRARVVRGQAVNADVVIEAPAELFLTMMLDTGVADESYMNKKYEVYGPPADATRFRYLGEKVQECHPLIFKPLHKLAPIALRVM
jgi:hypothetical protein